MESLYEQAKDEVDKMQRTRQETENYAHLEWWNSKFQGIIAILSYILSAQKTRQKISIMKYQG
jgi:hypothetical protein